MDYSLVDLFSYESLYPLTGFANIFTAPQRTPWSIRLNAFPGRFASTYSLVDPPKRTPWSIHLNVLPGRFASTYSLIDPSQRTPLSMRLNVLSGRFRLNVLPC